MCALIDIDLIDVCSLFLKIITKLKYMLVKVPLHHNIDKILYPQSVLCSGSRYFQDTLYYGGKVLV